MNLACLFAITGLLNTGGKASVVYGHTPQPEALWLNNTLNIDTGCVFGGKLTALRYPEKELLQVEALETYAESIKPFKEAPELSNQHIVDDTLDIVDITGKRIVSTRYRNVTLRAENSASALETMSRFAINPKWLVYLPPTMAAPQTSEREGMLEHPEQVFEYYKSEGVTKLIAQEKHMGSRAVLVICRDEETAKKRFGLVGEGLGVCYTRTGRPFFTDKALEIAFIDELRKALDVTGFWEALETNWLVLDAELMPWSQKAQSLLEDQYAAVGSAANHALSNVSKVLLSASKRGLDVSDLATLTRTKQEAVETYIQAYRHYCWPVKNLTDLKLAPFHILATEGQVHTDKQHSWHMKTLETYLTSTATPLWHKTQYKLVDLEEEKSIQEVTNWWEGLTSKGGEGMVVKPEMFTAKGKRGLVQPAMKVRGASYLSIIYGPEYALPQNLIRLRSRNTGAKRALAIKEFVLGLEALDRFVAGEALRQVHECVFGVLALESEAVDPRL